MKNKRWEKRKKGKKDKKGRGKGEKEKKRSEEKLGREQRWIISISYRRTKEELENTEKKRYKMGNLNHWKSPNWRKCRLPST